MNLSDQKRILSSLMVLLLLGVLFNIPVLVPAVQAQTSWGAPLPNQDWTVNQTLVTYKHDICSEVAVSANLYKILKDYPQPGQYEFAIATTVAANSRYNMGYTVSETEVGYFPRAPDTLSLGDDEGAWIDLGSYEINYYGAHYRYVFVSSNGFVVLDTRAENDYGGKWTSPTPKTIPSTDDPNILVAPFWRDLDPSKGGSIKYGYSPEGGYCISWNNIPNKANSNTQTFCVRFAKSLNGGVLPWGDIIFTYGSITNDVPTSIGIEDQTGKRGIPITSAQSGRQIEFAPKPENLMLINQIKISASKLTDSGTNDNLASIEITGLDNELPGGVNVKLYDPSEGQYKSPPIISAASLALGAAGLIKGFYYLGVVGFALDVILFVKELSPTPSSTVFEADRATQTAYVSNVAEYETLGGYPYKPWDVAVFALFRWRIYDPSVNHKLIINAQVDYQYDDGGGAQYTLVSDNLEVSLYRRLDTPLVWLMPETDSKESLYWNSVISEYKAETGVEIQRQTVSMDVLHREIALRHQSGDDPDIISMPALWLPEFACWREPPDKPILAIPPQWVQDDVKANWMQEAVDSVGWKGFVWGYPSEYDSWALVYNRKVFQDAIDAGKTQLIPILNKLEARSPYQSLTWEELKTAARALAKWDTSVSPPKIQITGFCPIANCMNSEARCQFLSLLWSNGGEYLDLTAPRTLFDTPNAKDAMQLYYNLGYTDQRSYDPQILTQSDYWQNYWCTAWHDETIAMMILPTGTPSKISSIRDAMGANFSHLGVAPIPKGPRGTNSVSATDSWVLAVSQKAENEGRADAAWNFLAWLNMPRQAQSIPMPPQIGAIPKGDGCSIMGDFLIYDNCLPSRISDQQNGKLASGTLISNDFWFKGFMDIGTQYGRLDEAFLKSFDAQDKIGLMFDRVVLTGADPTVEVREAAQRVSAVLPISGDIDLNGEVDIFEVVFLIDAVSTPAATPTSPKWVRGRCDFNDDGIVDVLDIAIYIQNFGRTGDPLGGNLIESLSSVAANSTALQVTFSNGANSSFREYFPPDEFTVDVNVVDVTDLYAFDFTLKYNTTVLTANAPVTLGSFFPPDSAIFVEEINNDLGYVRYLVSMPTSSQEGMSGNGTLATISFTVVGSGATILDLNNTKFSDSQPNPKYISHDVYDGYFANIPLPPIAEFTFTPQTPQVNEKVSFNASASYDLDGTIVSYNWDFGDGSLPVNTTEPYVNYTYRLVGNYTVSLVVTDDMGYQDEAEVTITVVPPSEPKADLTQWKAKPAHQHHDISLDGPINPFYALVQNLGGPSVTVKVNFTVYAGKGGALVTSFETSTYTFAEGTYLTLHTFDTSTDATPPEFDTSLHGTGNFYVEAQCYYYDGANWVGGKIKSFSFTVIP